ncbi:MAG TPA: metal ABC transporter permease [Mariprofundaceae bacterium]|nr:metal ABC transporter permease [Mariprofundaceae bacterium]
MEQDLGILWPAFLAGLLVLSTHVPLGQVVLKRGIIFIDIAVAQIAGMGVIAAEYFGWQADGWTVQIAAGLSALIGALLFNLCEKYWPEILEALIGIAFVLASSGSILLLAGNPHGGEHLKDLLVGQILWVGSDALKHTALLYAGILLGWFLLRRRIGRIGFYLLFALAITASVQLVGVYLVFTSLIVPALAVRSCRESWRLPLAYGIGIAGYMGGLLLSFFYDLPTGAITVWSLAVAGSLVMLLVSWLNRRRLTQQV